MIEHQIDRLDPEDQRILEAASVASAEFPASPLAAALDAEVIHIEERCEALAHRHQLLEAIQNVDSPEASPPGRYDFVHSLYRSVLYDRISPGRRAHLHARVDLHEEARYGDRAGEIAVELVDLLTLQYDWFTEGFDTRDLREAKELLELLRTHS
jgi:predicted ATPase